MSQQRAASAAVAVDLTATTTWKVGDRVVLTDLQGSELNGLHAVCTTGEEPDGQVSVQLDECGTLARVHPTKLVRYKKCICCGQLDDLAAGIRNMKCAGCMEALYCSRNCQEKHWAIHKVVCQKQKGALELDAKMKQSREFKQNGLKGVPDELSILTTSCNMSLPDHVQGMDNILAYLKSTMPAQIAKMQGPLGTYTTAYLSFVKQPDIIDGNCAAENQ